MTRGAGDLKHRVAFDLRMPKSDGAGNGIAEWREEFEAYAGFIHLRGGETVMAARLQGQHTLVIFVRASSQTRSVESDWRIRNSRDGTIYNIRDIVHSEDRAWIEFTCQSGVAAG
jgi:SPP1 family predicted phage head-tail adaptor